MLLTCTISPRPGRLGSISTDLTITPLLIAFFIFRCGFKYTLAMVVVLRRCSCPS
ncbi:MAG: hypothetical protein ACLSHC_15245 [Bilophila wadsworthia]